jgi:hypothetical protein
MLSREHDHDVALKSCYVPHAMDGTHATIPGLKLLLVVPCAIRPPVKTYCPCNESRYATLTQPKENFNLNWLKI